MENIACHGIAEKGFQGLEILGAVHKGEKIRNLNCALMGTISRVRLEWRVSKLHELEEYRVCWGH